LSLTLPATLHLLLLLLLPPAVIPPFHDAVDNAVGQLAQDGLLGVADFFVSGKYDTPMRQMHWGRRFFWRWVGVKFTVQHCRQQLLTVE
jgi:hypothetical protein